MSDVKKFLDQEGVAYLWSKINMNDYPNNEILMAVINAIDETKANKVDLNTSAILHDDIILSNLINSYILNIDYDAILAFDTSEVICGTNVSSVLGQAILG